MVPAVLKLAPVIAPAAEMVLRAVMAPVRVVVVDTVKVADRSWPEVRRLPLVVMVPAVRAPATVAELPREAAPVN